MKNLCGKLLLDRNIFILNDLFQGVRLPKSLYNTAEDKYKELGKWLAETSTLAKYDPHIFPQGSFMLGTAIKPFSKEIEYDIDLVCNLRCGYSFNKFSQFDLKEKLGCALREYTKEHSIKDSVIAKKRCWAITYHDQANFHMDILPCIPMKDSERNDLLLITDEDHRGYKSICRNWPESNPESYAQWFEKISNLKRKFKFYDARFDGMPIEQEPSLLKKIVMLLKRHRDVICKDDLEFKPASIIITTLAAKAYAGEENFWISLEKIITKLKEFSDNIDGSVPEIKNPKNENESFTKDWSFENDCVVFQKWITALYDDFVQVLSNDRNDGEFVCLYKKLDIPVSDSLIKNFHSLDIVIGTLD